MRGRPPRADRTKPCPPHLDDAEDLGIRLRQALERLREHLVHTIHRDVCGRPRHSVQCNAGRLWGRSAAGAGKCASAMERTVNNRPPGRVGIPARARDAVLGSARAPCPITSMPRAARMGQARSRRTSNLFRGRGIQISLIGAASPLGSSQPPFSARGRNEGRPSRIPVLKSQHDKLGAADACPAGAHLWITSGPPNRWIKSLCSARIDGREKLKSVGVMCHGARFKIAQASDAPPREPCLPLAVAVAPMSLSQSAFLAALVRLPQRV